MDDAPTWLRSVGKPPTGHPPGGSTEAWIIAENSGITGGISTIRRGAGYGSPTGPGGKSGGHLGRLELNRADWVPRPLARSRFESTAELTDRRPRMVFVYEDEGR